MPEIADFSQRSLWLDDDSFGSPQRQQVSSLRSLSSGPQGVPYPPMMNSAGLGGIGIHPNFQTEISGIEPRNYVLQAAPPVFTVTPLPPEKQGSAYHYGIRVKPVGRIVQHGKFSPNGYEIWRRWDDCLDLQRTVLKEYERIALERRQQLATRSEGSLYPSTRAASFDSLPSGPDPLSIPTQPNLPKLSKKNILGFRTNSAQIEQRGQEMNAFLKGFFNVQDDILAEVREFHRVFAWFGRWRRDETGEARRKQEAQMMERDLQGHLDTLSNAHRPKTSSSSGHKTSEGHPDTPPGSASTQSSFPQSPTNGSASGPHTARRPPSPPMFMQSLYALESQSQQSPTSASSLKTSFRTMTPDADPFKRVNYERNRSSSSVGAQLPPSSLPSHSYSGLPNQVVSTIPRPTVAQPVTALPSSILRYQIPGPPNGFPHGSLPHPLSSSTRSPALLRNPRQSYLSHHHSLSDRYSVTSLNDALADTLAGFPMPPASSTPASFAGDERGRGLTKSRSMFPLRPSVPNLPDRYQELTPFLSASTSQLPPRRPYGHSPDNEDVGFGIHQRLGIQDNLGAPEPRRRSLSLEGVDVIPEHRPHRPSNASMYRSQHRSELPETSEEEYEDVGIQGRPTIAKIIESLHATDGFDTQQTIRGMPARLALAQSNWDTSDYVSPTIAHRRQVHSVVPRGGIPGGGSLRASQSLDHIGMRARTAGETLPVHRNARVFLTPELDIREHDFGVPPASPVSQAPSSRPSSDSRTSGSGSRSGIDVDFDDNASSVRDGRFSEDILNEFEIVSPSTTSQMTTPTPNASFRDTEAHPLTPTSTKHSRGSRSVDLLLQSRPALRENNRGHKQNVSITSVLSNGSTSSSSYKPLLSRAASGASSLHRSSSLISYQRSDSPVVPSSVSPPADPPRGIRRQVSESSIRSAANRIRRFTKDNSWFASAATRTSPLAMSNRDSYVDSTGSSSDRPSADWAHLRSRSPSMGSSQEGAGGQQSFSMYDHPSGAKSDESVLDIRADVLTEEPAETPPSEVPISYASALNTYFSKARLSPISPEADNGETLSTNSPSSVGGQYLERAGSSLSYAASSERASPILPLGDVPIPPLSSPVLSHHRDSIVAVPSPQQFPRPFQNRPPGQYHLPWSNNPPPHPSPTFSPPPPPRSPPLTAVPLNSSLGSNVLPRIGSSSSFSSLRPPASAPANMLYNPDLVSTKVMHVTKNTAVMLRLKRHTTLEDLQAKIQSKFLEAEDIQVNLVISSRADISNDSLTLFVVSSWGLGSPRPSAPRSRSRSASLSSGGTGNSISTSPQLPIRIGSAEEWANILASAPPGEKLVLRLATDEAMAR